MNSKSKVAFLDTNTLLHYRYFGEIDWVSLFEAEHVLLVIPPMVTHELDLKKTDKSARVKKRASSILKKLDKLNEREKAHPEGVIAPVRDGVDVLSLTREPSIDYRAEQLDHRINDDRIIASVIEYRRNHESDGIVVVTQDRGLRIKCRYRDIPIFRLPEDHKLSDEPDETEKLKAEIARLKSRLPEPWILFKHSGEKRFTVRVDRPIETDIEPIREQLEHRTRAPRLENNASLEETRKWEAESKTRRDGIEKDVELYRAWNKAVPTPIVFLISNENGTCPATNVRAVLRFPPGLTILDEGKYEELKEAVKKLEGTEVKDQLKWWESVALPLDKFKIKAIGEPVVEVVNSEAEVKGVKRLQQGDKWKTDPIYIVFRSWDEAESFGIEYEIWCDELPQSVKGRLDVVVEKTGET